jgi:hypothetical protein
MVYISSWKCLLVVNDIIPMNGFLHNVRIKVSGIGTAMYLFVAQHFFLISNRNLKQRPVKPVQSMTNNQHIETAYGEFGLLLRNVADKKSACNSTKLMCRTSKIFLI